MLSIIAKLPCKEDKVNEAIEAFKALMVHVAKEPGTLYYTMNVDKKKAPSTIVILERYKDKAALDAHSSAPHFKEFSAKIPAFLAGKPEISIMEELHSI